MVFLNFEERKREEAYSADIIVIAKGYCIFMNRLRRVVSNTVISLTGQAVTWTSTLLLTIAYGRFLGDVKFGELYFAVSFVLLFGVPLEFGFNQQLTRDVAQEPARAARYLSNTLLIKMVLWLIL